MEPVDPKTYLWKTVTTRLGVDESIGVDAVFALLKGGEVSRGTVQRLKEGKTSVGVDQLSRLAAYFNIEVWELCVPPGVAAIPRPIQPGGPDLHTAFGVVERALAKVEPGELQNLLDSIRLLVIGSTKQESRREYVLSILSGEFPKGEKKRKTSNG